MAKRTICVKANSTTGKIIVSGGGLHKVVHAVVFSRQQAVAIRKAADYATVSIKVIK